MRRVRSSVVGVPAHGLPGIRGDHNPTSVFAPEVLRCRANWDANHVAALIRHAHFRVAQDNRDHGDVGAGGQVITVEMRHITREFDREPRRWRKSGEVDRAGRVDFVSIH